MATKANTLEEQLQESSKRLRMWPTWKLRLAGGASFWVNMSEEDRDFNRAWNRVLSASYDLNSDDVKALAVYAENLAAKPIYQRP